MISDEKYGQLTAKAHQAKGIVQFFRESPLVEVELDWKRDKEGRQPYQLANPGVRRGRGRPPHIRLDP
jgi:hypothetical protein